MPRLLWVVLRLSGPVGAAVLFSIQPSSMVQAAVSYTTPGAVYVQDFNGLPTNAPGNANIQSGTVTPPTELYEDGWQDDVDASLSPEDDVSIRGWNLYHSVDLGAGDGGVNGNQRLRFGPGNTSTGSFYAFAAGTSVTSPGNSEKALGFLPSNALTGTPPAMPDPTVNNDHILFMALRVTNDTGQTLTEFTLSYDGEQWRDGGSATPAAQSIDFSYKINPTNIHQIAGFVDVPQLTFTSPVFANTGGGAAVDGNGVGKTSIPAFTVTGLDWQPGQDLWLRWGDANNSGNDHGLAIDNVNFSATGGGGETLVGDHNDDGSVDAADYVAWQKTDGGNAQGYADFRENFGSVQAGAGRAVPEPSVQWLVGLSLSWIACRRQLIVRGFSR
jgi:hypothetical protein